MIYLGKEIEILSEKRVFGKTVAEIRILSTGEIKTVPVEALETEKFHISVAELAFRATAARIRNDIASQLMLAPIESSVIPLPHQILALEKIMSGSYIRYLLADEVGMGKTIEAGLVLKELKMRGLVKKTLILVSKTAMQQWQQELKLHFNEKFQVYDTEFINALTKTFSRFEADNEINIWAQHNQLIVTIDALRPIEGRQGWTKARVEEYNKYRIDSVLQADFDLLIIDESHKVGGSTQTVGRYNMADILCNAIPNVLLLSATPHRGKSDHFRRVMGLLDSDAFAGEGVPSIRELQPFVVRTEKRHAIDHTGKPLFNKRNTQRIVVLYDSDRHSKQMKLYNSVTKYIINGFNISRLTRNNSYGFVMILFQKMMSSSTRAILDAMQKRAASLTEERGNITRETISQTIEELGYDGQYMLDYEHKLDTLISDVQVNYDNELEQLKSLITEAQECIDHETDAKTGYLLQLLPELKRKENDFNLKFLIFTEFISTQNMLKEALEINGGFVCETINGSMDFERRLSALKNFKTNAQVLISTDAAGESLNMQFAHIVINYDMPWNPMVIEQRIGRVDRIGQSHEVLAMNFFLDNSVETRVYEVIEIKLNQIMADLGIDKTADVLDSTIERESINRLFLQSLLDPARFEQESAYFLSEIRGKLEQYKSTEGILPTTSPSEISADRVDPIKHSPIPVWLEGMTTSYLESKGIEYKRYLDGIGFKFPGYSEQLYTFDIRESINNPVPEPLSLQHEIIQKILSDAVPHLEKSNIPELRITNGSSSTGVFSIWHLLVGNGFETRDHFQPVFLSEKGEVFPALAQNLWMKLTQDRNAFEYIDTTSASMTSDIYWQNYSRAEQFLQTKFEEMERRLLENSARMRENKEKAFAFREKQLNKIGIDNIRLSRQKRLTKEMEEWQMNYDSSIKIVPNLTCLLMIRISNG